jgi:hypothetical protein
MRPALLGAVFSNGYPAPVFFTRRVMRRAIGDYTDSGRTTQATFGNYFSSSRKVSISHMMPIAE